MRCPYCAADSQVVDSRTTSEAVRRRRLCNRCKRRFTTYERAAAPSLKVEKVSGKTEPFDSDKLRSALTRVCRGRQGVGDDAIRRIVRDIEARLLDSGAKLVRSSDILDLTLARLSELDKVAYDRLAADYIDEDGHLRTEHQASRAGRNGAGDDATQQLGLFQPDSADD